MPYPVPIVEVAFDDGPYVVSPTWTDITAYVYSCDITRGRDDDWSEFYGSANLVLNNRTRRFDPFYTSGPYYGKLTPRRQIRIRATHGGTTYDVFRGFIQGWPPAWSDAGTNSTVSINAFDALQLLGSSTMPVDWAAPYIASLGATHYWKCNDPVDWTTGSVTLTDYGTQPVNLPASNVFQGSQLAPGLPQTSVAATSFAIPVYNTTNANGSPSNITMCFWASATTQYVSPQVVVSQQGWYIDMSWYLLPGTTNYSKFQIVADNGTNQYTWYTTLRYDASEAYHVAFTLSGTTGTIYINGIADTGPRATAASTGAGTYQAYSYNHGGIAQWCIFPSALTQTQIQNIVALSQGQVLESTSARVLRAVANTSFSSSLVSTPASPASTVLNLDSDAPPATTVMGTAAASEYAPLFVSKSGVLTLFQQNQIRTQTSSIVSQVTYGAGGVGIGQDVTLQMDGDSIRNVANIQVGNSGTVAVTNTSSVSAYGQSNADVSTALSTVAQANTVGNIVSGWGGIVYPLADEIEVVVRQDGAWGSTLALELMDRVTLSVAPPSGNTITYPMLLQRIRHQIVPGRWQSFIQGSARWAAVFILDTSVLDGTDLLG